MGVQKQEKVLFEMYNQYFNGTVSSVVDTGIKLWDGTHNSWKMEVVYQKLTGQANLTTLFAVRPDFSPYSGIRNRMSGNNDSLEFTISDSWNIIKNDGEFTTYISATYGNALRKNAPLDYDTFIIIRNGNILSIDYNGYTAEVLITNPLTNNLNLLIGCDYKGTNNQTQRYYTGTVQKFVITELPATYDAEVEYIQTDGKAYIDTGIKTSSSLTFDLNLYIPSHGTQAVWMFGSRVSASSGMMAYLNDPSSNRKDWRYGGRIFQVNPMLSPGNYNFKNTASVDVLTINDTITLSAPSATFTSNYNFYLLTMNVGGTPAINNIGNGARVMPSKIYVGGVLARDYIPVRKNGVGYLYDNVSGELFGNANSEGAFTYGSDKT